MANLNQVHQRQIKSTREEFIDFENQMNHVESRTRHKATIRYYVKTQWDQGTKTNIDSDAILDKIVLSESSQDIYQPAGAFESYVLDVGASDVKFDTLTYVQTKPAGTTITYYTRSGPIETPDGTWSAWEAINTENLVISPNGRYLQFKVELATSNTAVTPEIDEISLTVWGSAGLQEIFDARGPYKTVGERFDQMGTVYQLKTLPTEGQTVITIPKVVADGTTLKCWYNGQLVTEGVDNSDSYTLQIVGIETEATFSDPFYSGDVVVFRIEGPGAGVITIKENRIVDEVPTTTDYITYTLNNIPIIGKEEVYVEGIKAYYGADNDYLISGNQIIFNYEQDPEFVVKVTYLYL